MMLCVRVSCVCVCVCVFGLVIRFLSVFEVVIFVSVLTSGYFFTVAI